MQPSRFAPGDFFAGGHLWSRPFGAGSNPRRPGAPHRKEQPCAVADPCRRHCFPSGRLIASARINHPIYNVCDDEPASTSDVVTYAAALLGVEPPAREPFESAVMSGAAMRRPEGKQCRLHGSATATWLFFSMRARPACADSIQRRTAWTINAAKRKITRGKPAGLHNSDQARSALRRRTPVGDVVLSGELSLVQPALLIAIHRCDDAVAYPTQIGVAALRQRGASAWRPGQ